MSKQFAIPSRDHLAGISQQSSDRMAGRCGLPFVAGDLANSEHDLRNILLRGAISRAVESLQHAPRSRPLLGCHTRVRRNGATMDCREKSMNGFEPVKSFEIKRDDCGHRGRASRESLNFLAIAKRHHGVGALLVDLLVPILEKRRVVAGMDKNRRRGCQNNDAGVVFR